MRAPSPSVADVTLAIVVVNTSGLPLWSHEEHLATLIEWIERVIRLRQGGKAVPRRGAELIVMQGPHHHVEAQAIRVRELDHEDVLGRGGIVRAEVIRERGGKLVHP